VARSEDCTTSSIAAPVVVSSATPCPSAGTTHITVTTTVTVTGLPGGAPPKYVSSCSHLPFFSPPF